MSARLSVQQVTALRLVAAGRVTWGDLAPKMTARAVARWAAHPDATTTTIGGARVPVPRPAPQLGWMVDGVAAHPYSLVRSIESLIRRGLALEQDAAPLMLLVLTDAGRAALDRADT